MLHEFTKEELRSIHAILERVSWERGNGDLTAFGGMYLSMILLRHYVWIDLGEKINPERVRDWAEVFVDMVANEPTDDPRVSIKH